MNIFRSGKNPIISPENIKPSSRDLKVVGVFNCGVTKFKGEILLLMRVAEAPLNSDPKKKLVPILNVKTGKLIIKELDKADYTVDLSDSRFVKTSDGCYLTSISHLRIARSKNGLDFEIDKKPAMLPENKYEKFGIEDPRITRIEEKY